MLKAGDIVVVRSTSMEDIHSMTEDFRRRLKETHGDKEFIVLETREIPYGEETEEQVALYPDPESPFVDDKADEWWSAAWFEKKLLQLN